MSSAVPLSSLTTQQLLQLALFNQGNADAGMIKTRVGQTSEALLELLAAYDKVKVP